MKYQLTVVQLEKLNQMLDLHLKSTGMNGYQTTVGLLEAFRNTISKDENIVVYELNESTLQHLHQLFDSVLRALGLKGFESVMEMTAVFSNPIQETAFIEEEVKEDFEE